VEEFDCAGVDGAQVGQLEGSIDELFPDQRTQV
jgi:hypothetical protein